MLAVFPAKTAVLLNILNDKGRFIDNRILGNTVSKNYPVTQLEVFSKADGSLYNKRIPVRTFQNQY